MKTFAGLGTKLRTLLDLLDSDLGTFEAEMGLAPYRPRYSPVVRAIVAEGPLAIRDLAANIGVTHSAASQTVAQMVRDGLVTVLPGPDARSRIVSLSDRCYELLPLIDREWTIDETALHTLDEALPAPLLEMVDAAIRALQEQSWLDRLRVASASVPECDAR